MIIHGTACVFAFGIGSSVNRHLMEGLARAGMGEPFIITDPLQAPEQAARFRRMVESPVLTSVKADFDGFDVYDVEPHALPDVLGERPVIIFGKWRPFPAFGACLLFGLLDAVAIRLQGVRVPGLGEVPVQLIQALPYLLTMFLLAGFIGRAVAPKAIGVPYEKEH